MDVNGSRTCLPTSYFHNQVSGVKILEPQECKLGEYILDLYPDIMILSTQDLAQMYSTM